MEGRLDHLEKELSDWEAREQKFKKLFGSSVVDSKAFLKEKLAFYEVLDLKYGRKGHGLDPLGSKIIRQEKHKLQRKVIPNLWARLFYKLVSAVLAKKEVTRYDKSRMENLNVVRDKVTASGFRGLDNAIEQKMQQGLKEFSIPVSEHISEGRKMDYELYFSKGINGNYEFEGYWAKLSDRDTNQVTSCHVEPLTLKPEQTQNLLNGKAILTTANGQNVWVQMDPNDRDDKGNVKIRSISNEKSFDLVDSVNKLPLRNSPEVKEQVLSQLKDGREVRAILEFKGKEYACNLVANPLRNEITIFNEQGQQLSAVDLKPKGKEVLGEAKEMEKVNRKQMKVAR